MEISRCWTDCFHLVPDSAIGVDLGGTNLCIAVIDEQGESDRVGRENWVSLGRTYSILPPQRSKR
jgi:hypothetical protein